jgi:hypothetical protein
MYISVVIIIIIIIFIIIIVVVVIVIVLNVSESHLWYDRVNTLVAVVTGLPCSV